MPGRLRRSRGRQAPASRPRRPGRARAGRGLGRRSGRAPSLARPPGPAAGTRPGPARPGMLPPWVCALPQYRRSMTSPFTLRAGSLHRSQGTILPSRITCGRPSGLARSSAWCSSGACERAEHRQRRLAGQSDRRIGSDTAHGPEKSGQPHPAGHPAHPASRRTAHHRSGRPARWLPGQHLRPPDQAQAIRPDHQPDPRPRGLLPPHPARDGHPAASRRAAARHGPRTGHRGNDKPVRKSSRQTSEKPGRTAARRSFRRHQT